MSVHFRQNSPIVCQFILIFEVSAHRPIFSRGFAQKRRQRRTAIPADDCGNSLANQTFLARKRKKSSMGVGVAGYVNEARRHASAGRVNDIISGFCLQVAYFLISSSVMPMSAFTGLLPLPSKTNPFLIIVE